MTSYLYTPFELAIIIQYHNMDSTRYIKLLQDIHRYDNLFIQPEFRQDVKKFILAVMASINYISDPETYISEQEAIKDDMYHFGINNNCDNDEEYVVSHLIFKELRIRILYINKKGYAKMKLKTLLAELGYKKRSPNVIKYIYDCLIFYHIETSLRDYISCDINEIELDDIIIFRTVGQII